MNGVEIEKVNLRNSEARKEVEHFLESFGLGFDQDIDCVYIARKGEQIIASGAKAQNVLKGFAVLKSYQGEGLTAELLTLLLDQSFAEGVYHSFLFTKPENIEAFTSLHFNLIEQVEDAALLETGMGDIQGATKQMMKNYLIEKSTPKAALVMNCNPFTLGHQYLIEKAAEENEEVLIFIVEEEKSSFPFRVRYDLVKKGASHLLNVTVIPGGEYIISSATFPSYFLREENEKLAAYTTLDAKIFGRYFCNMMNIKKRYVGSEPYCKITEKYNETLSSVLAEYGVETCQIKRKTVENDWISASIVRNFIRCGKIEEIRKMVPEVTWGFINSKLGREILEKIRLQNSPH